MELFLLSLQPAFRISVRGACDYTDTNSTARQVKMRINYYYETLNRRDHVGIKSMVGRVIVKWIIKKWC